MRDIGNAMMAAYRHQRREDLKRLLTDTRDPRVSSAMKAYLWWGWPMLKSGKGTAPGSTYPYWSEPKWHRRRCVR